MKMWVLFHILLVLFLRLPRLVLYFCSMSSGRPIARLCKYSISIQRFSYGRFILFLIWTIGGRVQSVICRNSPQLNSVPQRYSNKKRFNQKSIDNITRWLYGMLQCRKWNIFQTDEVTCIPRKADHGMPSTNGLLYGQFLSLLFNFGRPVPVRSMCHSQKGTDTSWKVLTLLPKNHSTDFNFGNSGKSLRIWSWYDCHAISSQSSRSWRRPSAV